MVFSTNPLSLTVPDPAFESWLRDSGYLEILDQRSSSSTCGAASTATTSSTTVATAAITGGLFVSLFSHFLTVLSLFTLNPFSKLTVDDFGVQTPSWTGAFIGDSWSYSFPSGSDQARLRVHENVKRYARNYASLFILFFACALYQMPVTLIGLISSLAIWDLFKFCNDRWGWDQYPVIWQVLVRIAQCVFSGLSFTAACISHCSNCSYSDTLKRSNGPLLCTCRQLCSYDSACCISEADTHQTAISEEIECEVLAN